MLIQLGTFCSNRVYNLVCNNVLTCFARNPRVWTKGLARCMTAHQTFDGVLVWTGDAFLPMQFQETVLEAQL